MTKDFVHPDYVEGYMDGYKLGCPLPTTNRSERYRHSFWVGRREKTGKHMRYEDIIKSLNRAEELEGARD